jgi:hypothetical protein
MFLSHDDWPPPPRWEPEPQPPSPPGPRRISVREERVLLWLVGLNLVLLFVAPIAGGSVIQLLLLLAG